MTSQNFAFGNASDALIQICCPGIPQAVGFTGRELRRSKKRKAAFKTQIAKPQAKGFVVDAGDL